MDSLQLHNNPNHDLLDYVHKYNLRSKFDSLVHQDHTIHHFPPTMTVEELFTDYGLPLKDLEFLRVYLNDGMRQRDYALSDKIDCGSGNHI